MPKTSSHLREILLEIQELKALSPGPLVVFDLDSTLFDVQPRLERVLKDFANQSHFRKKYPQETQILEQFAVSPGDWGAKGVVMRAREQHPQHFRSTEFQQDLKDFWKRHFFSNDYLWADRPYEGAPEFVKNLYAQGLKIVYLTGRDGFRMGDGSHKVLLHWGFPLDGGQSQLVLKPQQGMDDALFKRDWFAELSLEQRQRTWFFENEPVNVHQVRKDFPEVRIVFFNSVHSGKSEPPADVAHILHYQIDYKMEGS